LHGLQICIRGALSCSRNWKNMCRGMHSTYYRNENLSIGDIYVGLSSPTKFLL